MTWDEAVAKLAEWCVKQKKERADGLRERIARIEADCDAKLNKIVADAKATAADMGIADDDPNKLARLLIMSARAAGVKFDEPGPTLFAEGTDNAGGHLAQAADGTAANDPAERAGSHDQPGPQAGGEHGQPGSNGVAAQPGGKRSRRKV